MSIFLQYIAAAIVSGLLVDAVHYRAFGRLPHSYPAHYLTSLPGTLTVSVLHHTLGGLVGVFLGGAVMVAWLNKRTLVGWWAEHCLNERQRANLRLLMTGHREEGR